MTATMCVHDRQLCHCAICAPEAERMMRENKANVREGLLNSTGTLIDPGNEVSVNPAKTSVPEILARIERDGGHGIRANEVLKLADFAKRCHALLKLRPFGWYPQERAANPDILGET